MNEEITQICLKVEEIIGEDWFLIRTENGFDIYFCRSCNEKYKNWIAKKNLSQNGKDSITIKKARELFFRPNFADSVSFYGTVSMPINPSEEQLKAWYKKNGILKFEIKIEEKWSKEKILQVTKNNCILESEILEKPLYKADMRMFSDYRFWLPESSINQNIHSNFSFQRLPYTSVIYDFSFLLNTDKPFFNCDVLCANDSSEFYHLDQNNFIEEKRRVLLVNLAETLGLVDFKIVN